VPAIPSTIHDPVKSTAGIFNEQLVNVVIIAKAMGVKLNIKHVLSFNAW
jgi:hypothetical protein